MITNATEQQLNEAMSQINANIYRGNIQFKEMFQISKNRVRFTLRVFDSRMPGHRLAQSGLMGYGTIRRIPNACWHVHGDFFEALFSINPEAWIKANGKEITIRYGNWTDRNIGSQMYPVMYSDACECEASRESRDIERRDL